MTTKFRARASKAPFKGAREIQRTHSWRFLRLIVRHKIVDGRAQCLIGLHKTYGRSDQPRRNRRAISDSRPSDAPRYIVENASWSALGNDAGSGRSEPVQS